MLRPVLLVAATLATPAAAATRPFDVAVANAGGTPLSCEASIAHWYSDSLGTAAPGEVLRFTLRADPATGAVFLTNAVGDEMPVQRLWCGPKGRSWAARAEIPLDRRAGVMPAHVSLRCTASESETTCAPE